MEHKFYLELTADSILIREKVFVEEQGFKDEFDDIDARAIHLVIYENDAPIANGRIYRANNADEFMIGRVAVLPEFRGRHIGHKVIMLMEEQIIEMGGKKISLSAQSHAKPFYEKLGYLAVGEPYLEDLIEHIHMEKHL